VNADAKLLVVPAESLILLKVTALESMAVVKYAPALCNAVLMFDASPNVIALPTLEEDRLDPVLNENVPVSPFIEFTT
jgi:hypothetical protein